jgi:hypothetical protein
MLLALSFAFVLAGCQRLLENLPPLAPGQTEVIEPNGAVEIFSPASGQTEIIEPNGAVEIVEPGHDEQCFVRARHFTGLVQKSCSAVAHETR